MKKDYYIEVINNNPHTDELMLFGFHTAVQMLAIRDDEVSKEDMLEILKAIRIKEDER